MSKPKKIYKMFASSALVLLEENIQNRYIYLSFPQYVALVQEFVKSYVHKNIKKQKKTPAIFTGLCITPLQWFNYKIMPSQDKKVIGIQSMDDITSCWADTHWLNYHEFLIRLRCTNFLSCKEPLIRCIEHISSPPKCNHTRNTSFNFYRYLLTVDSDINVHEQFNFPKANIVEKQLNDMWIHLHKNGFVYDANKLSSISYYQNMPSNERAYLVTDTYTNNAKKLGDVFMNYFQLPTHSNIYIDHQSQRYKVKKTINSTLYNDYCSNSLPEDFIIFGYLVNGRIDSSFALGCDVSEDKVKLMLLNKDDPKLNILEEIVNDKFLANS